MSALSPAEAILSKNCQFNSFKNPPQVRPDARPGARLRQGRLRDARRPEAPPRRRRRRRRPGGVASCRPFRLRYVKRSIYTR